MPGLYINDGGATGSALSSALAGIANNFSPKTRAEAELLRQQTEAADRNNWLLSTRQRGVLSIPGVTGAPGVNADPTASAVPSVADTLAGAAVPPVAAPSTALGTRDQTAGFSPFNAVLAGSYAADPSMGNLTTGINLGRNATLGPGHGFDTGSAIEQAQSTPQHIAPGDTLVINPKAGNAPGNVVYGGDPAAAKAEEQQRVSNQTDADRRAGLAESASQQLPENDRLMEIYNRLVNTPGTSDTASVIGSEGMKLLSRWTNADLTRLSPREGAILAIQQRLGAVVNAQLQSTQAGDPVRGLLNRIQPPDPARLDPEQFRAAMEQYKRVLKYQAEEGSIAYGFRTSGKTKADSDKYLADLKAHADAVFKEQQAGSGGEGGGGGGGGGQVHVYTSEAEVNADIAAGELHDGDKIRIGRGPNAITGTVGQLK